MSQSSRQRALFAAEDFSVVYDSFRQANFQAYDYDTIRAALVDYIQQEYPENFNDWIQSSEFVAIIETLAFLAHSLAFRIDLSARENFLSTAERRESVLRIADFLGYTPARHLPARGVMKVRSIRTTQNVYDIAGENLKNTVVDFEDNYQNFLLVLNQVLSGTNKFGRPTDTTNIDNIRHEIYRTNIAQNQNVTFSFNGQINGTRRPFEVHSVEVDQSRNSLTESEPNSSTGFDLVYRNDNQGLGSDNTGFFVGFKQGNLQYNDITIDRAIPDLVIDLRTSNVNNSDIWVQHLDNAGVVQDTWTPVDSSFGAGAVFNDISSDNRSLYSVKTTANDNVNLVFGDGVFSDIPRGNFRIWYRTGLNQSYTLEPEDFGGTSFSFDYNAEDGNVYKVTLDLELRQPVSNASAQESVSDIKRNAGRVFTAQDRMISGSDYSIYPGTVSDNVSKIKAVNRTYAGHSRFIRRQDPTGEYQNVDMIARDGYLYKEPILFRETLDLPSILTTEQIYERFIDTAASNPEVINLFYNEYNEFDVDFSTEAGSFEWQQITRGYRGSTGYFTRSSAVERVGQSATTALQYAEVGSIVEFVTDPYIDGSIGQSGTALTIISGGTGYTSAPFVEIRGTGTGASAIASVNNGAVSAVHIVNPGVGYANPVEIVITGGGGTGAVVVAEVQTAERLWARVVDLTFDGYGVDDTNGNVTGLDERGRGAVVLNKVVPNSARVSRIFPAFKQSFSADEREAILNEINLRNTFGLRYDAIRREWKIINANDLPALSSANADTFSLTNAGNETGNNLDDSWIIRVEYRSWRWSIFSRRTRYVFGSDEDLHFFNQHATIDFNSETGKPERDRVTISSINSSPNGSQFPISRDINMYSYRYYTNNDGFTDSTKMIVTVADSDNDNYPDDPLAFKDVVGLESIYFVETRTNGIVSETRSTSGREVNGRPNLTFIWRRVANSQARVDPSLSNLIDIFVLTQNYNTKYREWIADDRRPATAPEVPTNIQLQQQFASLQDKKAVSDSIIYRPAGYRVLFGELAEIEMQGKFRVVKVPGTPLTDNEIKTRILTAINEFFAIDNWDFGETFYFTELSAYIHQELQGVISSIVISPTQPDSVFGRLFQVTPDSHELFIPDVSLRDIEIVDTLTQVINNNR